MVSLHFKCPACCREYVFEIPDAQDEADNFSCVDCGCRQVALTRYERGVDTVIQETLADHENRLNHIEEYLADQTATKDEPFQPPETH